MDALDDAASLHRYHLGELLLDALGGAPSQMAFATLGTHHHACSRDPKALGSSFVGL
jgi:hypothetical protein